MGIDDFLKLAKEPASGFILVVAGVERGGAEGKLIRLHNRGVHGQFAIGRGLIIRTERLPSGLASLAVIDEFDVFQFLVCEGLGIGGVNGDDEKLQLADGIGKAIVVEAVFGWIGMKARLRSAENRVARIIVFPA